MISATTKARWGSAGVFIAPTVMAGALFSHPWIGSPGDPGFLAALASAVAADPTHWAVSHLGVAVGSGLLVLAFLAVRSYLREAGEDAWSAVGVPFIVMGSTLFALLPAMELAPVAAAGAGTDIEATQAALEEWFVPIHLTSGVLFLIGALVFAKAIATGGVLSRGLTRVVVTALVVTAAARLLPLSAVLLYVGPAAGIVALWPLAYAMWRKPMARPAREPRAAPAA